MRQTVEGGQMHGLQGAERTAPEVLQGIWWTLAPALPAQVSPCVDDFLSSPCVLIALLLSAPAPQPLTQPRGCKRGIGSPWPGFESWPFCLLAGSLWAINYLHHLCFLICKIQVTRVPPSQPGCKD